jgi:hypothetical protein
MKPESLIHINAAVELISLIAPIRTHEVGTNPEWKNKVDVHYHFLCGKVQSYTYTDSFLRYPGVTARMVIDDYVTDKLTVAVNEIANAGTY